MSTDHRPEKLLLVSDLDDTLLGEAAALQRFADFVARSTRPRISVAYASGRFYETIAADIATTSLPDPVAVIGGVGSEIRSYPGGEFNSAWTETIADGWSSETARRALAGVTGLQEQPEQCQSDYKLSYYYKDASEQDLSRLRQLLNNAGLRVNLIYSSQRDLDILPAGVDKGAAAAFVAADLGYPASNVLVSGNSANDSKLFSRDFHGIVVANAHEELKRYGGKVGAYISPHAYADGVRDGIEYWINEQTNHD